MKKEFHIENRRKMMQSLNDGDVMLFFSGTPVRKTADEDYPFFANRFFVYLTGIHQPESVLMIQKRAGTIEERLFLLMPDADREVWTGRRLTGEETTEISGIQQIEDIQNLQKTLDSLWLSSAAARLWLCFDALAPENAHTPERDLANRIQQKFPFVTLCNSYPLLSSLRKIKSPEEIEAIRKAMRITEAGICRMMRTTKPGMMEYELESEFLHELAAHGQRRTAFPSIISSGERNFYLHYAQLRGRIQEGELVLTDVGAAYDEYCTDISRVFPANGAFHPRQKALYEIALQANRAVMEQIRPEVPFSMPNRVCQEQCFSGLKTLGLIDDFSHIRQYVWHGVSHHVGLDTHDVGGYESPMAENMVFTVDAGIYVREWNIGLRIEDNILVTANGCENLSASISTAIQEIEDLMR